MEESGMTDQQFPERDANQGEHQHHEEVASLGRRRFLAMTGGLTAATLTAASMGGATPSAAAAQAGASGGPQPAGSGTVGSGRRAEALRIRTSRAIDQLRGPFPEPRRNGDEDAYPAGIASYTKGLPHNARGEVDAQAYRQLRRALDSGDPADFAAIPMAGKAKLTNPQAAFAFDLEGADAHALVVDPPPGFADEAFAAEMVECYWLALVRDVPYSQYGNEPITAAAVADLRRFADFADIDTATLFRSPVLGAQTGPYVSQFLLQPYLWGSTPVEQRYRTTLPGSDHLTSYDQWLEAQNGRGDPRGQRFDPVPRYIRNGRDLGEFVHRDFSYQGTLIAALVLLDHLRQFGSEVLNATNPYRQVANQTGSTTFGGPHITDLVARVANHALKAAWYQKWVVHRRLRPEEYAGRVHNHIAGVADYPIHPKLFDSPALERLYSRNGSHLCPQAYPEGCPTHPALPGAHATIAGAGITVLKAFFNESFVISNPVVPSDDGLTLRPWTGEPLTIGNELDKLAFNLAFGRDSAGVHFRNDELEGILSGGFAALSVLTDDAATNPETRFLGP
jgi:hypothetical protein